MGSPQTSLTTPTPYISNQRRPEQMCPAVFCKEEHRVFPAAVRSQLKVWLTTQAEDNVCCVKEMQRCQCWRA